MARRLGISTSTIRKYEDLGLLPPVTRSKAGYRQYTLEHMAYLRCLRGMLEGFTTSQIKHIFTLLMAGKRGEALWLATRAQAGLYQEKNIALKIAQKLLYGPKTHEHTSYELLTIHEISRETGVPVTTIRYWDKVGLLDARRNQDNNYRMFTTADIRQVLTIYALKFSVFSTRQRHSIELIRQQLAQFDTSDQARLEAMMQGIEAYLDQQNLAQVKAVAALYHLCQQVASGSFDALGEIPLDTPRQQPYTVHHSDVEMGRCT